MKREDSRFLDFEEREDLERLIEVALQPESDATEKEKGFLADMGERLGKWDNKLLVSPAQWNWVGIIGKKLGVEVE